MVKGDGQLAKCFYNYLGANDICIFASGVSNSNCTEKEQFDREEKLLNDSLRRHINNKFVYFSSCALSSPSYPKNEYYRHKENMESIIKKNSENYYIFRLPQLFGNLFEHGTLINFIYKSIKHGEKFNVYDEAYRYVIEMNDLNLIAGKYLMGQQPCITVDIANNYKYKVIDIVGIFEKLLNKKAHYELIKKEDQYDLDLSHLERFIEEKKIDVEFGEHYLISKLKEKLCLGTYK